MSSQADSSAMADLLLKKTWNAMRDYHMVEENDHILVGLSGGKDSLALLSLLSTLSHTFQPRFKLSAIHVGMKHIPYRVDLAYLRDLTEELGVPFIYREAEVSIDEQTANPCFICSWTRRKTLFTAAKELGCAKIALGHHQDDVLSTLLMNQVFQGSFSTIVPVLRMTKFPITLIRPLYYVAEDTLKEYAIERQWKKILQPCPYETASHRTQMQSILTQFKAMNPQAAQSMCNAMVNIQPEYLPPKIEKGK